MQLKRSLEKIIVDLKKAKKSKLQTLEKRQKVI